MKRFSSFCILIIAAIMSFSSCKEHSMQKQYDSFISVVNYATTNSQSFDSSTWRSSVSAMNVQLLGISQYFEDYTDAQKSAICSSLDSYLKVLNTNRDIINAIPEIQQPLASIEQYANLLGL